MGRVYRYQCEHCNFEEEFSIGGGFLTNAYYEESEKLPQVLQKEIAKGEYGELLHSLVLADQDKELKIDCEEALFQCQCRECLTIIVCRGKRIYSHNEHYDLSVEMNLKCPKCGNGKLKRVVHHYIRCPQCRDQFLKLLSIGCWD